MKYPKKSDIQLWIPTALSIFQSIMPPIGIPYPPVYITTDRTFRPTRERLLTELECKIREYPDASIMEYIHGDKGGAILIRQNLLPDKDAEHFCLFLWHELGHFYAINTEKDNLHRYNDPGLPDDSKIINFTVGGVGSTAGAGYMAGVGNNMDGVDSMAGADNMADVGSANTAYPTRTPSLGWSDERKRQEGYWFWQEFIAECISKYVSYKHRSGLDSYHPEAITWHPDEWGWAVRRLETLLDEMLTQYPTTVDEYTLAHYFANLLMDDFIVLYRKAAEEGKLKVYDKDAIAYPKEKIDPTCIDEVDPSLQKPLRDLKKLLDAQISKERFWETDNDFLLEAGTCIGELSLAKLILLSEELTLTELTGLTDCLNSPDW